MKYSFYNIFQEKEGVCILYNTLTENILALDKEVKHLLLEHSNKVSEIEEVHPSLYQRLILDRFIVEDEVNEQQIYIESLINSDLDSTYNDYRLIINPTLDCNLRCWYCYEKHLKGSVVNEDTLKNIQSLIRKIVSNKVLKNFKLSFFGGEPLMKFDEVIFPLVIYTEKICKSANIKFMCNFTSNALLLTKKVIDSITLKGIPLSVQVPFDGDEIIHNSIKKSSYYKEGSYKTTLKNIFYGLKSGVSFIIRCNCTKENIDSFKSLIDEFKEIKNKEQVVFSVQRIWQEESAQILLRKEKELYKYIFSLGFNNNHYSLTSEKCYADRENSVVINYNGDVFKCTANDFTTNIREGKLYPKGNIIYNERHQKRLDVKYKTKACIECNIYPICYVCTQQKLKSIRINGLVKECKEEEKQEILNNRINNLLTSENYEKN